MRYKVFTISTGYDDDGQFCLFARTDRNEFAMPVSLRNSEDVMNELTNTIIDIQTEERRWLALRQAGELD